MIDIFCRNIVFLCVILLARYTCAREYPPEICEKLYACGYNSLYLFLQINGHQTDFETLKSNVTIGENGTSLYDLQRAAAAVGVRMELVRCSYSALCSVNMPVIVWINRNHSEAESKETIIGHFIVLTSANEDGVKYLDGTSGQRSTMKQDNFVKQWNGMILTEKNKGSFLTDKTALSVFLLGLACLFFRWGFARKHVIPVSFLFLLLNSVPFCLADGSTRIWRTRENETTNALYLLLKCGNLPCDYGKLETELKTSSTDQSLDILRIHARKRGLNVDVFRCSTPDALERIPIPFLLHAEGGNDIYNPEWNGNYLFVMGRGRGHYMIIDCGTLVSSEIQEETLRRYWSGFVLGKPSRIKYSFTQTPLFLCSMIGLGVLLAYFGFSPKKKMDTLKTMSAIFFSFFLLFSPRAHAEETPPKAVYSSEQIKETLHNTANNLKSLKVFYRSEYYTNPEAPPKTYLYRKILAMSPYYLNHTNSHPCEAFSWNRDPLLQQAFIQETIGYNIFPFCNCYFVMLHKSDDPLPGTLPGEFFFNVTGIWPMDARKAPTRNNVPVALRDVAKNPNYDHVLPIQEKIDDRWCHVLCWQGYDTLWLDMERGAVLLAREVCHSEAGALAFRYELSNHQEAAPGFWIPKKLRNIQFDYAAQTEEGRKRRVIDGFFDVEEMEVNTLTETDFDFTPPPGALLSYDARDPNAKYPYQSVLGGEEMLDRIAEWVYSIQLEEKGSPKTEWGWIAGFLVIPLILFFEIRRRRQS